MLGLRGEVSREQFVALANNQRPDSKGRLTARTNGTRTETRRVFDPKTQTWEEKEIEVSNRRAGYDICLSAPKSVSLYLAMTDDKDVEWMLREAAAETMSAMEANMETRLRGEDEEGRNRDDENRTTGNMAYAAFLHRETRPIEGKCDPHAHIHCYAFNATFDPEENRWKAAQFGNIKSDGPWYEAVFHARLADKLEAAGLGIRRTDRNFELASVSRELVEKFSKRTMQIERLARDNFTKVDARARALMKETGLDYADAYAKVKHDLGAESREKKSTATLGHDAQLADWRAQMTQEELQSLTHASVRMAWSQGLIQEDKAKEMAISELFERESVKRQSHAAALLLRRGIGRVRIDEALQWARSKAFVQVSNKLVTTKAVMLEEEGMIKGARAGQGKHEAIGRGGSWEMAAELTDEQKKAVTHVLGSRDLVTAITGRAGTGKTTMAKEAVKAVQTLSGRSVIVLAPSSAAVETLKDSGFRGADTLANFQDKDYLKDRARGQILWIDEAGLLSAKQMRWAIDFASRNGCRVILSGDTRQHHSVERGDALRVLERVGAVSQVVLTKIFRQLDPAQRAAIYDLSEGETDRGFDKLKDLGAIVEISDQAERLQKLSEKHLQALKDGVTSLIVTPTHEEGRTVTTVVRDQMKQEGLITGQEHVVGRLQKLNLSESQQRDSMNYEHGRVVVFHKRSRGGFRPGEQWEVSRRDHDGTVIVQRHGQEKPLDLDTAQNFEVYAAATTPVAPGDQLRITSNFRSNGDRFINNELVKVLSLDEQKMVVSRGNGKEAVISRRDLVHVDQGVTVTSYSSQSKGPDQMLCSAPVRSFGAVDRKQFYVTMSRARRSMHLYTDSIDGLRQAVCRTGERLSAVELANDAEAYLQRMQEVLARNTFQAKRTANLQHGIEPPLGPTLEQEQDRGIWI